MCGRYTLKAPADRLARLFDVPGSSPDLEPRYNIAPSQEVLAVTGGERGRRFELLRWGLVASWSKDPSHGPINARAETVARKPTFRKAFEERRCLLPADGYFEWKKRVSGPKQPYYFRVNGGEPFAFAGIHEVWHRGGPDELRTCALITTLPNALGAEVHDRMPVILPRWSYEEWLDPGADPDELHRLLVPYPADQMDAYRVSTHVNRPANDDPRAIERA